jgi:glycolate oxidase
VGGGVMISLTRMNRILEISHRDRYAVVEPGCVNIRLTRALAGSGFHYAPDPSSQGACTIGGNVATNSGGPHTLKYGVTVNHVLGVEYVDPSGELIQLGGPCGRGNDFDLTGLFVGSEGTFGVVTRVWVRIMRDPSACRTMLAIFNTVADATTAISRIIAEGIVPAALETLDQGIIEARSKRPSSLVSRWMPVRCSLSRRMGWNVWWMAKRQPLSRSACSSVLAK